MARSASAPLPDSSFFHPMVTPFPPPPPSSPFPSLQETPPRMTTSARWTASVKARTFAQTSPARRHPSAGCRPCASLACASTLASAQTTQCAGTRTTTPAPLRHAREACVRRTTLSTTVPLATMDSRRLTWTAARLVRDHRYPVAECSYGGAMP